MNSRTTRTSPELFESSSLSSSSVHSEEDVSVRHRSPSGSHRQILHQIDFLHSLLNTFLPFGSGSRGESSTSLSYTDHSMRAPPVQAANMLPLESYFPPRPMTTHHTGGASVQEFSTARSSGLETYINNAHSFRNQAQAQAQASSQNMNRRYRSTVHAVAQPSFPMNSVNAQSGSRQGSRPMSTSTSTPLHAGRTKTVYILNCVYCDHFVCHRGMRAILLADVKIELFSTDCPPSKSVQLVEEDYSTPSCACKLRDIACLVCGNVLGYHVTQPCTSCLSACNNGHFWMFHSSHVVPKPRVDSYSRRSLSWSELLTLSSEQDGEDLCGLRRKARRQAIYKQHNVHPFTGPFSSIESNGDDVRADFHLIYERYCR